MSNELYATMAGRWMQQAVKWIILSGMKMQKLGENKLCN